VTRILVTGGSGQVGTELLAHRWPSGFQIVAPTRAELDLSDFSSVRAYLDANAFDGIINAGAYTAVDRAEKEVALAWAINALAPAVLAERAAKSNIPIIQLSTDYVFDGKKQGRYVEDDPVAPLNVYGASKEGGEQAVRTACRQYAILRTSWVVSPHGHNFVRTMLRLGRERDSLRVVADQHGAPTVAADVAAAVVTILTRLLTDAGAVAGTYHFSSAGRTTWFELARYVFANACEERAQAPGLFSVTSAEYPTPAVRPSNSLLSNGKIRARLGIEQRSWQVAVADVLSKLPRHDTCCKLEANTSI
jgi:dTDP-4-dehydrorhamnose reductase